MGPQDRSRHPGAGDRNPPVSRGGANLTTGTSAPGGSAVDRVFREEYGRAVSVLVRYFGDIDLAEEAVQDAFIVALQRWRSGGVPPSPAGWIITTARNKAIDRLRREASRAERHAHAVRLLDRLLPDEPEVEGLLALMLLTESRRSARQSPSGDLVLLADQDRRLWDEALIAEGQALVRRSLRRNRPGPYQVQAAINAVHSDAATADATDWRQILQLYDQLLALTPTPVVALNRAVALAEVEGPQAALRLVEALDLDRYYLFHAARAEFLRRLGRATDAADAYRLAAARTENAAERAFLHRRGAAERAFLHRRGADATDSGRRGDDGTDSCNDRVVP